MKTVTIRDYQEQTAADHNNIQANIVETFEDLARDTVTTGRQYAGFTTTKTAQATITIQPGRMFDQGILAKRSTPLVQSMTSYLAASSRRIVTVSAFSSIVDTDVQERDFLIDAVNGVTEPRAVSMTRSRDAVLAFTAGSENIDPQPAALAATHVAIAYVLLDTTQVLSVTMVEANRTKTLDEHETRLIAQEAFKDQVAPRVNALASDIAAITNAASNKAQNNQLVSVFQDLARIKSKLEIPTAATDYGADRFLTAAYSDTGNAASLAYDAKIVEGIRFADAAATQGEVTIFSANDDKATLSNGILLPRYTDDLKLVTGEHYSSLGIAQYGYQTNTIKQLNMSRVRIRYGSFFTVCTNNIWWTQGTYDSATNTFKKAGETFEVVDGDPTKNHQMIRLRQVFTDTYQEPYWGYVVNNFSVAGAQVGQTFLNSNDVWATKLGFYIDAKAGNEDIRVVLCEVTNGQPDISRAILVQAYAHAGIVVGWNRMSIPPTFLRAGKRYGVVLISNANHQIGMTSGESYLDGTFFYSTDGAYYLGDLTKDMMIEVWGAKFNASQVTIELNALSLSGGIRSIDLLMGAVIPASTQAIFEVRPNGTGAWIPLSTTDLTALDTTPPLCQFRVRFVGTRDIQAGIQLTGSVYTLTRPKTAFKHVSTLLTLATASRSIYVKLLTEDFDETPHDLTCQLYNAGAVVNPTTTTVTTIDATAQRYEKLFYFYLAAVTTSFRIIVNGATNNAGDTFHVSERVHWAV